MELTTFGLIAWLLGGWMFLYGLPAVFASGWFRREIVATTKERPGLAGLQLFSILLLLFGLWILSVEYRVDTNAGWAVLIPIVGYLSVLKGMLLMWAPKWVEDMAKRFYKTDSGVMLIGVLATALGILFWWLAFSVY